MDKGTLALLGDRDRMLVLETERAQLMALDEDEALELHKRIRGARNKATGVYRRTASARVGAEGGRGKARPKNTRARAQAEAFEEALSRVSTRLAVLSRASAAELRAERIAAARSGPAVAARAKKATRKAQPAAGAAKGRSVTDRPRGDRNLNSPVSAKQKAGTKAAGTRKQARRDSR